MNARSPRVTLTRVCVQCGTLRSVEQNVTERRRPYACPPCLPVLAASPHAHEWVAQAMDEREQEQRREREGDR